MTSGSRERNSMECYRRIAVILLAFVFVGVCCNKGSDEESASQIEEQGPKKICRPPGLAGDMYDKLQVAEIGGIDAIVREIVLATVLWKRGCEDEAIQKMEAADSLIQEISKGPKYSEDDDIMQQLVRESWISSLAEMDNARAIEAAIGFREKSIVMLYRAAMQKVAHNIDCEDEKQLEAFQMALSAFPDKKQKTLSTHVSITAKANEPGNWGLPFLLACTQVGSRCRSKEMLDTVSNEFEGSILDINESQSARKTIAMSNGTHRDVAILKYRLAPETGIEALKALDKEEMRRLEALSLLIEQAPEDENFRLLLPLITDTLDTFPLKVRSRGRGALQALASRNKDAAQKISSPKYHRRRTSELCTVFRHLKSLVRVAPGAVSRLSERVLDELEEALLADFAPSHESCLSDAALLQLEIGKAGKHEQPCRVLRLATAASRDSTVRYLRKQKTMASAYLVNTCPQEAEEHIGAFNVNEDPALGAAVVTRMSIVDQSAATKLAKIYYEQIEEEEKVAFALRVLSSLVEE
jgi:hypothetical protein